MAGAIGAPIISNNFIKKKSCKGVENTKNVVRGSENIKNVVCLTVPKKKGCKGVWSRTEKNVVRVNQKKNVVWGGGSVWGEGGDRGYPIDENGIALSEKKVR